MNGSDEKQAESIGYCQGCGLLDHHLVDEICPTCTDKVIAIDATLPDELAECSCNDDYVSRCWCHGLPTWVAA